MCAADAPFGGAFERAPGGVESGLPIALREGLSSVFIKGGQVIQTY
jgi:hypothetical protein